MYKSFIGSQGTVKGAGVGFLPVPTAKGTFTSGSDNLTQLQLEGVEVQNFSFKVGDSIIVDSAEYPLASGTIVSFAGGQILTDIVFTVPSTAGTIRS